MKSRSSSTIFDVSNKLIVKQLSSYVPQFRFCFSLSDANKGVASLKLDSQFLQYGIIQFFEIKNAKHTKNICTFGALRFESFPGFFKQSPVTNVRQLTNGKRELLFLCCSFGSR